METPKSSSSSSSLTGSSENYRQRLHALLNASTEEDEPEDDLPVLQTEEDGLKASLPGPSALNAVLPDFPSIERNIVPFGEWVKGFVASKDFKKPPALEETMIRAWKTWPKHRIVEDGGSKRLRSLKEALVLIKRNEKATKSVWCVNIEHAKLVEDALLGTPAVRRAIEGTEDQTGTKSRGRKRKNDSDGNSVVAPKQQKQKIIN